MSPSYEPTSAVMRILERLVDDTLCEPCMEAVTGLAGGDLEGALHRLTALFAVGVVAAVCDRCQLLTPVFQLVR